MRSLHLILYLLNDDQHFFFYNTILLHRWIYTKKVIICSDLLSCSKKSNYYTNADVKTGENSTYQELDLSREEIQYQNTTIQWFMYLKWRNVRSSFDWCTCILYLNRTLKNISTYLEFIHTTCIVILDILIIQVS